MKYAVEEVRALFEAWAEENGYDVLRIEPDYNDGFTAAAWHGYQAAYADRIKADEGAVAMAWLAADGSGRVIDAKAKDAGNRAAATGSATAIYSIPLFPHPPAQTAQVDAFADRLRQSIMRDTFQPTAEPVAQGKASLGRCKACGRATRAVCDGLDDNGLGCTNATSIDLAAVREVIAHLRSFRSNTPPTWAHLDDAADKLEAAIKGVA